MKVFLKSVALFSAIGTTASADMAPDSVAVLIGSDHLNSEVEYNEFNPGVILVWDGEYVNTRVGAYFNSLSHVSATATFTTDYLSISSNNFDLHPFVGVAHYPTTGRHEITSINNSDWVVIGGLELSHDSGLFMQLIPGDGDNIDGIATIGFSIDLE